MSVLLPALGPRLVFFTGGTALRGLSRSLTRYTHNSVHLVTPFDSGGSSAALREAFALPAVGDIRNRLAALADSMIPQSVLDFWEMRLPAEGDSEALRARLRAMGSAGHPCWRPLPSVMADVMRVHLGYFLERMPDDFRPQKASMGNLLLAGGYLHFQRNFTPVLSLFSRLLQVRVHLLQVRKRAYAGNEAMAQSYVDAIGSADAMFDAIVDERALEFVGEMLRKTDLIRWNLLKTKMDETKQKLNDLNNWTGDFSYLAQGDGYVYYKVEGTKLEMYGLGRDEQTAPDATWIPYTNTEGEVSRYAPCASNTENPKFTTAEINRLYDRDPDTRQYWPIFQSVVDNSQGQIHNDYGY